MNGPEKTRSARCPALLAGALGLALAGCPHPNAREPELEGGPVQSDLRVTKVVLYQSGVGYFERQGRINGNILHLRIRPDQVMDVLKSLTVIDKRQGRAVTVSLPAEKTRLMRLSQLPPQVRTSGGLLAIAVAFRGATAVVRSDKGEARGRIVGVENIGNEKKPDWRLTLLQRGGVISSHKIGTISSLRVLNKTLTVGLSKSLDVTLNKGRWKPVRLTVRLSGEPPHDLIVSYVVPMPIWKPAYRLVVDEKESMLLQGWSVVDNLSGESWRQVALSLTAGTPLAFKYDLYTPRDVHRPDLTPSMPRTAEAPPPAMDATAREKKKDYSYAPRPSTRSYGYGRGGGGTGGSRYSRRRHRYYRPPAARRRSRLGSLFDMDSESRKKAEKARTKALERSYRTLVSGRTVGSLFRYDIQKPVTVPDRSSALVSIINKRVPGNDVLYFLVGSGKANPYRAVRFRNATGYVMERGPITIYREGTFVGEALGGRIEKGATAFVPYALEGRVIVHLSDQTRDEGLKLIKMQHGYLTVETQLVTRFTYKVTDRTGEKLTLYVGRQRRSGWKVVKPKNVILEKSLYYAPIPLKASGVTKFTVKEATPVRRTLSMFDSRARKAVALYLKGSEVPEKLRDKLQKLIEIWDKLSQLEIERSGVQSSIYTLRNRQADIRANVKVLGTRHNRDLRRKLLKNLTEVERSLSKLTRRLVELNMERSKLRQRLRVLIKLVHL